MLSIVFTFFRHHMITKKRKLIIIFSKKWKVNKLYARNLVSQVCIKTMTNKDCSEYSGDVKVKSIKG